VERFRPQREKRGGEKKKGDGNLMSFSRRKIKNRCFSGCFSEEKRERKKIEGPRCKKEKKGRPRNNPRFPHGIQQKERGGVKVPHPALDGGRGGRKRRDQPISPSPGNGKKGSTTKRVEKK